MRRLIGLASMLLVASCVPHTKIQGAPCDCPAGYECCDTEMACIKAGDECPPVYPASSEIACTADSLCLHWTHACRIWKADDELHGPSDCRQLCPKEYPCSPGEVCDLVPTNASPLSDPQLTWVCVPAVPEPGCEDAGCRHCSKQEAGELFCDGGDVHACNISTDARCGVTCARELREDCAGTCSEEGGAHCVP